MCIYPRSTDRIALLLRTRVALIGDGKCAKSFTNVSIYTYILTRMIACVLQNAAALLYRSRSICGVDDDAPRLSCEKAFALASFIYICIKRLRLPLYILTYVSSACARCYAYINN